MKARIELYRKVIRLLYESLFALLLLVFFHIVFMKKDMEIQAIVAVFLCYILSYVVRNMVYSYGKIVFFHLLAIPVIVLFDMKIGTIITLVLLLFHLIFDSVEYGMRKNKLKKIEDFPWQIYLFGFISILFAHEIDNPFLEKMSYIIPVVLLFLYYVMVYLEGVKEYIESTKDVSGLPLKRIIKTNSTIVMLILFVIGLALLLCRYIDFERIIKAIWATIIYVIRFFAFGLSFIFKFLSTIISHDGVGTMEVREQYNDYVREGPETGIISDMLILQVFFVAFVLYVTYLIVKRVIKRLMMHRVYEQDVVENMESMKKDTKKNSNKEKKRLFLTPEEKIRKYYRNRIMREKYDIRFRVDLTSEEIANELLEKGVADVSEITSIYSDVRYGNVVPDKTMIKRAGRLSKE